MLNIVTKTVEINKSAEHILSIASDMRNYKKYLPEDKVTEWQSDEKECSFKIKSFGKLSLILKDVSDTKVIISNATSKPFAFTFNINAIQQASSCQVNVTADVNVNPFMKAMVQKPLSDLFNSIVQKIKTDLE